VTTTLDRAIETLPVSWVAAQIEELDLLSLMMLETEAERGGVFSQMVAIAAREWRVYRTPPEECLRAVQSALRLRATDSTAQGRNPLQQRLTALRPKGNTDGSEHDRTRHG
jgi:hypothetical protein